MKIHKRVPIVNEASAEIAQHFVKTASKHNLTSIEMLGILHDIAGTTLKYALRAERHPENPDQPSGLE